MVCDVWGRYRVRGLEAGSVRLESISTIEQSAWRVADWVEAAVIPLFALKFDVNVAMLDFPTLPTLGVMVIEELRLAWEFI
jgi:hypothetical protein